MNRPILSLKPAAPVQPVAAELPPLPPRPVKRDQPLNQLLTFIVVDRKPYHHATYEDAAMERTYLQAVADRAPRKGRWRQDFRVMKVLNLSGQQLEGKVVVHGDRIDEIALEAALITFGEHWGTDITDSERIYMRKVLQSYLDAMQEPKP